MSIFVSNSDQDALYYCVLNVCDKNVQYTGTVKVFTYFIITVLLVVLDLIDFLQ